MSEQAGDGLWCLCGFVDARADGSCGNCGLRIMTDDDEADAYPSGGEVADD